jgi:inner membrane protein
MDSLTQITLGAAVGEATLGRKVGNRAMIWGALAGTIPDLDVLANVVTDELSALAYHRAFTPSLLFAVLVAPVLGWLVHRLYGGREGPLPQSRWSVYGASMTALFFIIWIGSLLMPIQVDGAAAIAAAIVALIAGVVALFVLREIRRQTPDERPNVGLAGWIALFFAAIITHPLLDACTTYGTQLFEPFGTQRVAWNNISVVDPLYTGPFLLCLIVASRLGREQRRRRQWNTAGLVISSLYLAWTAFTMLRVDRIFATSLEQEGVATEERMVSPTIFNSVLWQGVARTPAGFRTGLYSLLDDDTEIDWRTLPANHELLAPYRDTREVQILSWFSKGFYNVLPQPDGSLQFNDLRFGVFGGTDEEPAYIFRWRLRPVGDGKLRLERIEEVGNRDMEASLEGLWDRLQGEEAALR